MKRKKVALLAAVWDGEVLKTVIDGIKERLSEKGWDLHVFLCFPVFGIDSSENFGNYNIYSLINYEDYEGFILWINVVQGYDMLKKYYPNLFSCGKPFVSLEVEIEGISTIVSDGYKAMYQMVEHLIVKHGCREMNYVGGSLEHPDGIIRKKAYIDALKAHGIPIDERRIRDYHFINSHGRQAYRDFKELGIEAPDAVVCANDAMALGYCQEAESDGKYPPEDFLITGYDDDGNARIFTPKITTVAKNEKKLGYLGCDSLLKLINGEEVPKKILCDAELVFRGSCGCYSQEEQALEKMNVKQLQRQSYYRLLEEQEYYDRVVGIRQDLALATTEDFFKWRLQDFLKLYDIGGFAMSINQDVYYSTQSLECTWKIGYCKTQYVMLGARNKEVQEPQLIKRKELIPDYLNVEGEDSHVYMFTPIHNNGAIIGYFVVLEGNDLLKRRWLAYLSNSINTSYVNLRNLENLQKINKRLDSVYIKDALTDLYNRFGYVRDGYEMYEKSKAYGKPLMVMFMDMDHLKYINDTFGHTHGDNALILFSGVLKKCAGEKRIVVRYGGDEFLIIGPVEDRKNAEEFKHELEKELTLLNEKENLPYLIEASIGYVLTDPKGKKDLDAYVVEADELMYAIKKQNRKNRGDDIRR
ncbi:MAG: GGDEF domain-containing protein [Lachnospiraceae bacterium]|nr:GGDEF domain-containing protein [Lachnospiraceae bacterium]